MRLIGTNWTKFGSNWIKLVKTRSNRKKSVYQIKLDQIGSNWIKRDQIGSSRIKSDETGLNQFLLIFRYQIGQKKKNWIKLVLPYFLIQFPRKLFFFEFGNPKVTVHKVKFKKEYFPRKLFAEIRYINPSFLAPLDSDDVTSQAE